MTVEYGNLPFAEAERFFRAKINIPTRRWDDLKRGEHARGFMVAGAQRDDLLCDFHAAIDKGIAQGTTLEEFRADFDTIVAKHGWSYNGSRGWRTRVIYDTNLRTSYMAGRYQQMSDPDVLAYRPYWRYRHGDSRRPRVQHLAWNGMVLAADDPWWSTHYPPNGWGCKCSVEPLSRRDLGRMGKAGPDQAPPIVIDPKTGAPVGIDKGWDYNVGEAAFGRRLSARAMDEWRAQGKEAWQKLTPGNWQTVNRPKTVPVDTTKAKVGQVITDPAAATQALLAIIGGSEAFFTAPTGQQILVAAESLINHMADDLKARSPYLPCLPEVITDPYEVWLSFEQHKGTGKVALRQRYIKVIHTDKDRAMIAVVQANKGMLETWTIFPRSKMASLKNEREGKLLWGRED